MTAMKAVTKAWMAGIIVVLVCGLAAVLLVTRYSMRDRRESSPSGAGSTQIENRKLVPSATEGSEIVNPDWPMFRGGPNLSGRAPGALPDELKVLWKFKTGGGVKSSPAVVDGLVFIGHGRSDARALVNAVKGARLAVERGLLPALRQAIQARLGTVAEASA